MTQNDPYAHVHARIAEHVSRELDVDVSASDVYEILHAGTIGWPDGVVEAVVREANEYSIPRGQRGTTALNWDTPIPHQ